MTICAFNRFSNAHQTRKPICAVIKMRLVKTKRAMVALLVFTQTRIKRANAQCRLTTLPIGAPCRARSAMMSMGMP
jgi:hypothetical protein